MCGARTQGGRSGRSGWSGRLVAHRYTHTDRQTESVTHTAMPRIWMGFEWESVCVCVPISTYIYVCIYAYFVQKWRQHFRTFSLPRSPRFGRWLLFDHSSLFPLTPTLIFDPACLISDICWSVFDRWSGNFGFAAGKLCQTIIGNAFRQWLQWVIE